MNKFIIQAFTFSLCFCFCISASCSNETDDLMEILKGDSVIESSTKVPLVLNISCFRGDCATVLCSVHGEIQKTEKTLNMTITLPLCNISKFADISMKSKKISLNDTFKKLYSDKKLTIESKMTESVNDKVNWNTSLSIKVNGNLSLNYNLEFNNITVCLAQKTTPITTSTKAKPMSTSVTTPKKPQTGKSNETDDLVEILKGDIIIESSTKVPLVLNISCSRGDCATVDCSVHGEIQKTEKTLNMTITLPLCNISKFADISMKSMKISLNDTFKKLYSDEKLTIESKMTESVNDKVNWNTSLSFKVNGNFSLNYNLEFNNITVCLAQKTTPTAKTTKSVMTTSKVTTKPTGKSTPKVSNTKSNPPIGRIVLLVAAILILIGVVAIAIYCRKRKRLSNQPAYYNDIAINDPLRDEFDDQHDYTDDDELPLFS